MRVVSCPDPDYRERSHDQLWLLVGDEDYHHDGATAYYLGADHDTSGADIASGVLQQVIEEKGLDASEAVTALGDYRSSITR